MGIQIDQITLHQIRMPLVHFFETSFGRTTERHMVLVEVKADGISGWGEVTAGENPFTTKSGPNRLGSSFAITPRPEF